MTNNKILKTRHIQNLVKHCFCKKDIRLVRLFICMHYLISYQWSFSWTPNIVTLHSWTPYPLPWMKFSITDFFSKRDQIRSSLQIWSHFLEKPLMENFIFCAVLQQRTLAFWCCQWVLKEKSRMKWVNRNSKISCFSSERGDFLSWLPTR